MFELKNHVSASRIKDFCRKHHIIKLSVYGFALQGELKPDSDIDVLVEFEKNHIPGLLDLAGMEMELSEMICMKVDLRTPAELSLFNDNYFSLSTTIIIPCSRSQIISFQPPFMSKDSCLGDHRVAPLQ